MDRKNPSEKKPLSFDDLHVTQYRPGEDELTNYRAMKRKKHMYETTASAPEYERDYKKEYATYQGTPEQIARRSSRNKARRIMGNKAVKGMDVGHKDNNPMNNDPSNLRNEDPSDNRREPRLRNESTDEALDMRQRLAKSRSFRRYKSKIKLGRDRAKKRMAKPDVLKRRANKAARNVILKKLTKGIPKSELSFARRNEIEKRLDKPNVKKRLSMLARRMYKDVRKKEVDRKKG